MASVRRILNAISPLSVGEQVSNLTHRDPSSHASTESSTANQPNPGAYRHNPAVTRTTLAYGAYGNLLVLSQVQSSHGSGQATDVGPRSDAWELAERDIVPGSGEGLIL